MESSAVLSSRPIRAPKAAEVIAEVIRGQIARGELKKGDPLPGEAELMRRFGVSRPTLREALRLLESESLIVVARGVHGGARVQLPDCALAARHVALLLQLEGVTLADVHEARMLIEPSAARLAAERSPKRAARMLGALLDEAQRAGEDVARFTEVAVRFPQVLVELSGNRTLALLVRMLRDLIAMQAHSGVARQAKAPDRPAVRRRVLEQHRRLVELIAAGDATAAEEHWRAFLREAAVLMFGPSGAKALVTI